jgi:hypothetical protein
MKTLKALGLASGMVAAALVGGTLISVVSASPGAPATAPTTVAADDSDTSAYCDLWRQTFADQLGVSVDDLTPAAKAAAIATIDEAVANGDLPEDIATRMKEQIQNATGDGCRLLGAGFHAWGRHAARVDWAHDWVGAAADVLGLDQVDLMSDLRSGQTLQEIADAQGVSYADVSQAILDAAQADLSALVDAGKITQDRADQMLANLSDRLDAGEFPPMRGAGGMGGPGLHRGMNGGYGAGAGALNS